MPPKCLICRSEYAIAGSLFCQECKNYVDLYASELEAEMEKEQEGGKAMNDILEKLEQLQDAIEESEDRTRRSYEVSCGYDYEQLIDMVHELQELAKPKTRAEVLDELEKLCPNNIFHPEPTDDWILVVIFFEKERGSEQWCIPSTIIIEKDGRLNVSDVKRMSPDLIKLIAAYRDATC